MFDLLSHGEPVSFLGDFFVNYSEYRYLHWALDQLSHSFFEVHHVLPRQVRGPRQSLGLAKENMKLADERIAIAPTFVATFGHC